MGVSTPIPLGQCLGVALGAAPGSTPGPGCSLLVTLHGAEPALLMQCLNPLLAVAGGQRVLRATGHVLAAPVDVLVQASQHHIPQAVSWKLRPLAHQQYPIINHPCEAFEMTGIVHVQQRQDIRYALLLIPMPLLGASQHGEAQNFVGYNELLIHASLPLHLVKYIK